MVILGYSCYIGSTERGEDTHPGSNILCRCHSQNWQTRNYWELTIPALISEQAANLGLWLGPLIVWIYVCSFQDFSTARARSLPHPRKYQGWGIPKIFQLDFAPFWGVDDSWVVSTWTDMGLALNREWGCQVLIFFTCSYPVFPALFLLKRLSLLHFIFSAPLLKINCPYIGGL